MKVAASPRIHRRRCPKVAFKSTVISYSKLLISNPFCYNDYTMSRAGIPSERGIIMKIYALLLASLLAVGFSGCGAETKPAASSAPAASSQSASVKAIHEIAPASEKVFQEASTLYAKGQNREALLTCDKALEIDRENYKALSLKGLILALDVSPEQGIGQVLKALKINPDYTQAFYDMAMAQKLAKHYDESISYFQKCSLSIRRIRGLSMGSRRTMRIKGIRQMHSRILKRRWRLTLSMSAPRRSVRITLNGSAGMRISKR